jgi:membrane protease YdiL (CAAX protease family)
MSEIIGLPPEPLAPPPEKRLWGFWATAGLGLVIIVVLFLVALIIVVIMAVGIAIKQSGTPFTAENITDLVRSYLGFVTSVSGIIAYAAGTGLILAFIKARGRAGIGEYLGLKRISWKVAGLAVLITAACLALTTLIGNVASTGKSDSLMKELYNSTVWPVLFWLLAVVFGPIFEEALFRGFVFEGFRNSRLGLIGTIILTSFVWTFFHLGYDPSSLAAIFFFGLVLGAVRYKTGSLWSTMLMHACFNLAAMVMIARSAGG